ncbi:unnamed protein product [Adineta ricciae]|uniref:Apple domain-containing protein n=1 Tax=Adineta ricciae TaxID=249248 RepID=A0A815CKY8_ADIRI|nr:unnamed protein product [Adineta ricciae]CAF1514106.1 unnamed protein product [Adineta ricciae]
MYLVLIIFLFICPINAIILSQVYRSSIYHTNSSCARLSNVTLAGNASIQSCIWECAHQDQCRTAVYFHENRTCLLYSEDCQSGNVTSSESGRASVICYRTSQGSSTECSPRDWKNTGNMNVARYWHTASILSNGKALVTGGWTGSVSLNSAELYDPSTGNWTTTGNMSVPRDTHTASILSNGKVLVTGGSDGSVSLNSAELYDPSTGSWTTTERMSAARYRHTASILSNGKVLVTGGSDGSVSLNSAELYDPSTGNWTATGNMSVARYRHTASILSNKTVLVTGGCCPVNTAELY